MLNKLFLLSPLLKTVVLINIFEKTDTFSGLIDE